MDKREIELKEYENELELYLLIDSYNPDLNYITYLKTRIEGLKTGINRDKKINELFKNNNVWI